MLPSLQKFIAVEWRINEESGCLDTPAVRKLAVMGSVQMVPMLSLSITEGEEFIFYKPATCSYSSTAKKKKNIKCQSYRPDLKLAGSGSDCLKSLFPEEIVGLLALAF